MRPGTIVLTHGPLDQSDWWSDTAVALSADGHDVIAPQVAATVAPHAVAWIAGMAQPLHSADPTTPLVFVAHGQAGPLLPALARTQRAARRQVGGYVFVNATLPRPGPQTHLDLLRAADPDAADDLHSRLHAAAGDLHAGLHAAAGHDLWTEQLPPAIDWPDAPCAYVRSASEPRHTGPIDWWARSAASRGWPVDGAGDDLVATLTRVIAHLPG